MPGRCFVQVVRQTRPVAISAAPKEQHDCCPALSRRTAGPRTPCPWVFRTEEKPVRLGRSFAMAGQACRASLQPAEISFSRIRHSRDGFAQHQFKERAVRGRRGDACIGVSRSLHGSPRSFVRPFWMETRCIRSRYGLATRFQRVGGLRRQPLGRNAVACLRRFLQLGSSGLKARVVFR